MVCAIVLMLYFGSSLLKSGQERVPLGTPEVVVVTFLDDAAMSPEYMRKVMENRKHYAKQQGMRSFTGKLLDGALTSL